MNHQLLCPACVSFDVTLPHPAFPDNDARCESCGLVFGPQCPGPETDVAAFIDAVPASALIFGGEPMPPPDRIPCSICGAEAIRVLSSHGDPEKRIGPTYQCLGVARHIKYPDHETFIDITAPQP